MTTMTRYDRDGNKVIMSNSGVYLELKDQGMSKKIFQARHGDFVKRVRERNLFKAVPNNPMIGFSRLALQMIQEDGEKRYVFATYKGKEYKIKISRLLNGGKLLHFKSKGYEPQLFFPLKQLEEEDRTR